MALKIEDRVEKLATAIHPEDVVKAAELNTIVMAHANGDYDALISVGTPSLADYCRIEVPQFATIRAFNEWMAERPQELQDATRVMVCGQRRWSERSVVKSVLEGLGKDTLLITSGERGAESVVREVATGLRLPVVEFPVLWDLESPRNSAGPKALERKLKTNPVRVIAFHPDPSSANSTVTRAALLAAYHAGIPVTRYDAAGNEHHTRKPEAAPAPAEETPETS